MNREQFRDYLIQKMTHRGFIWGPEPEIYGGSAGFYTYAPLGKILKNNVENKIRDIFIKNGFWEIEAPTIMPKSVWKASGHLDGFTDPLIECKNCKNSFNAVKLLEEKEITLTSQSDDKLLEAVAKNKIKCPSCGGPLKNKIHRHNLMMGTTLGRDAEAYNRPETATTTYLSFKRLYAFFRRQLPIRVFQIGKAYRNEISPRQHVLRGREFTQAEGQLLLTEEQEMNWKEYNKIKKKKLPLWPYQFQKKNKDPVGMTLEDAIKKKYVKKPAYAWCLYVAYNLFKELGVPADRLRYRQHDPEERAFYADDAWDIEINLRSFGWMEVCGVHDRTDYDLKTHSKHSNEDLSIEVDGKTTYLRNLEIAFGSDRSTFALLDLFFKEGEKNILKLPRNLAPIQVAVFPLVSKDKIPQKATKIYEELREKFMTLYDGKGSIGRRYARMDEVGTPLCVTIDYDSLKKNDLTIRDRDTAKQIRVKDKDLIETLKRLLEGENLNKFGKFIK